MSSFFAEKMAFLILITAFYAKKLTTKRQYFRRRLAQSPKMLSPFLTQEKSFIPRSVLLQMYIKTLIM
jgi:hypothetical protein